MLFIAVSPEIGPAQSPHLSRKMTMKVRAPPRAGNRQVRAQALKCARPSAVFSPAAIWTRIRFLSP
jgi:hypothetical protein